LIRTVGDWALNHVLRVWYQVHLVTGGMAF